MTAVDVDALPPRGPGPSRRLPRRAVVTTLVVALALAVAAAGWLGVRSRVELQVTGARLSGFEEEAGGLFVAEDPEPGSAVAVYVVRNDGPVPATISLPAETPGWTAAADLQPEDAPSADTPGARTTTLAPGESAGVRLVLGWGCFGTNADVAYGPSAVALDVTALGITRQVRLDLSPVPMIRSTVPIPADC